jgi:cytochrome c oxidase assembly protein subunit 15
MAQPASASATHRAVAWWLLACCALVFAMVVVGGVTRLTHSGLSITEWQPIVGTLPPLSQSDWETAFAKYRLTPEYQQVNKGMGLDEFKGIFWWEYFHRLLGRVIGVAFLIPFLWFLARRAIPAGYGWKLAGIFVLGGLQGAMGWYMVKSGLVDDPRVSQFRLTAHLGLAFVIFAAMWIALGAGLVWNQGGVDAAWAWIGSLPLLVQAVVWLLFLPVVGALWVWESSWPIIVRLVIVVGLAGWSLMIFLPRSTQA